MEKMRNVKRRGESNVLSVEGCAPVAMHSLLRVRKDAACTLRLTATRRSKTL